MSGLLIADGQSENRQLLERLFLNAGFEVTVANSVGCVLCSVYKKQVEVVLLGAELDGLNRIKLVRLLRGCSPEIAIILVAGPLPLMQLREMRTAGVFYHALPPANKDDGDELLQAVTCALSGRRSNIALPLSRLAWCQANIQSQP